MGIGQDVGHSIGQKTGSTGKRIIDTTPPVTGALFQDNFDTGSRAGIQNGLYWTGAVNATVSAVESKSGSYSHRHRFNASPGCTSGTNSQIDIVSTTHYPDIWVSYDLFIPTNWDHRDCRPTLSANNKTLLYVYGLPYNGGAAARTGPKLFFESWPSASGYGSFTPRISAFVDGAYNPYTGTAWYAWDDAFEVVTSNDLGEWMHIVMHVTLASSANNDGVWELWKTDWEGVTTKELEILDGPWYHTYGTGAPYTESPGFNDFRFFGAQDTGYDVLTDVYVDNVVISADPLPVP